MQMPRMFAITLLAGLGVVGLGFRIDSDSTTELAAQRINIWDRLPGTQVAILDRSEPGSPLVFSGFLTLWEEPVEGGLRSAPASEMEARNISNKTILGLVVEWELFGSWGQEEFPGKQVEDCFFASDVILPGGTISFKVRPSRQAVSSNIDTSRRKQQPQAFAYVRYIQFTDGSEFGSQVSAGQLFAMRMAIGRALRSLDRAYRHGGEEAFLEELNDRLGNWGAEHLISKVRKTQKEHGTMAAVRKVRRMLAIAKEHQKALDQND